MDIRCWLSITVASCLTDICNRTGCPLPVPERKRIVELRCNGLRNQTVAGDQLPATNNRLATTYRRWRVTAPGKPETTNRRWE